MANLSPIPLPDPRQARSGDSAKDIRKQSSEELPSTAPATVPPAGPRKLIRPTLPARALGRKDFFRRNASATLAHHEVMTGSHSNGQEATHAEAFYFQKQAQTQTPMVFILEDGERIEGYIEWYDRNAIKVRNHTRKLIYKSSIKYLYKASDNQHHI
jgi:sRNA-binding regulator protein Hfq